MKLVAWNGAFKPASEGCMDIVPI